VVHCLPRGMGERMCQEPVRKAGQHDASEMLPPSHRPSLEADDHAGGGRSRFRSPRRKAGNEEGNVVVDETAGAGWSLAGIKSINVTAEEGSACNTDALSEGELNELSGGGELNELSPCWIIDPAGEGQLIGSNSGGRMWAGLEACLVADQLAHEQVHALSGAGDWAGVLECEQAVLDRCAFLLHSDWDLICVPGLLPIPNLTDLYRTPSMSD